MIIHLVIAFLRERRSRTLLTILATAAAVSMVIWVTSSYEALHKTYDEYANLALGRYELAIAPISGEPTDFVPSEAIAPLRNDPAVKAVDPMWAGRIPVLELNDLPLPSDQPARGGSGSGSHSPLPSLLFIATEAPEPPFEMAEGNWIVADDSNEETPSIVVRADVANQRGISIDDHLTLELPHPNQAGETSIVVRVDGMVNAPTLPGAGGVGIPVLSPSSGEAFISIPLAERITGEPFQISLLGVKVDPHADITQFRFRWAPRLSDHAVPLQFQQAFEIEEALDQASAAQNVRMQSYAATGVAMLVAMLVIYCSLSMGVTERIRQYAILRAVVLTRGQVGLLILIEGLVLGGTGLVAGVALGWSLLKVAESLFGDLLYHGVAVGTSSFALATIAAIGGAMLASLVPAYQATRVKPIDAMTSGMGFQHMVSRTQAGNMCHDQIPPFMIPTVIIGLVLLAVGPLIAFVIPPSEDRIGLAMAASFACITIGFVVLTPSIVVFVDRLLGPLLAHVFDVEPKLLASQVTSNIWRSVGASVSMAFGLGLFVGIQVWGFTMLESFVPGDWTPDAMVLMKPGLPPDQVSSITELSDVDASRCLPLVVEQPRLVDDIMGSADRPSVIRQDNVIIVGIDPAGAFAGERPLLELEWVAGTPEEAVKRMQQGHACVVPDHFLVESGLKLGETIAVDPPRNAGETVEYTIVGAVKLPGWHWQTKLTGLRPRTHRAAALVFADYDSVAADFDLRVASHVWFSYQGDSADVEAIESSITGFIQANQVSETDSDEVSAKVVSIESIRDRLLGGAKRWLWMISVLPLVTLLIACIGVLNVIVASVQVRRWEFGVLRSIGFTSSELARAILVEGLMIALVAGVLSVGFGILTGWCGAELAQYVSFFGGLHPPLVIPWLPIVGGVILVGLLGILTAAWPALAIRRARPMSLLQSGGDFV
ncbi:Macrolide export ATP-binding/permease protein MacB [Novipirellula aureliae]|uniref:Macrolide export ATP-binding/permease protein MacB n=1 Tax=Novipirellula aureliae TaxID=2527966 RepID=A0A5C6DGH0_9BACT|nr:FtsX-like permease family protein [Novipirellula aureliae]TWU35752.1 Macrolide export ATP-binding/permease protein MacB [Novipirellula aureliae]